MRKLPSLNALKFFDSAARLLNFSLAAQELFVTHSAVSQQIRQLEEWTGSKLFERVAGGVRLTDAGLKLQLAADQALNILENSFAELRQTEKITELTLAAESFFLSNWLIPRLQNFEAQNPDIRLNVITSKDVSLLQTLHIDAMVLAGSQWPDDIDTLPLFPDRVGVVCTPGQQIQHPADVPKSVILISSQRPETREEWARSYGIKPCEFRKLRDFDDTGALLEATAAGLGDAIVHEIAVKPYLSLGRLIAPLGFVENGRHYCICTSPKRKSAALDKLTDWISHPDVCRLPVAS